MDELESFVGTLLYFIVFVAQKLIFALAIYRVVMMQNINK